jgi:hypothetical protein
MSTINQNPASDAGPADRPATPAVSSTESGIRPDQAVDICMTAYKRAYDAKAARGQNEWECEKAGRHAYRLAMPSTVTLEGVQGFIACITHGIHIGVWSLREPNQLLYAAQVALAAQQRAARKR